MSIPGAHMRRSTRQRDAIRSVIESATRPLSAEEILVFTREEVPGIGIATIYRNLKLLLSEGGLKTIALPGDNPRYELMALTHHHHFQCRACERVFDIPKCPGPLRHLAPRGFTVDEHEVILYGRCRDCRTPRSKAAKVSSTPLKT